MMRFVRYLTALAICLGVPLALLYTWASSQPPTAQQTGPVSDCATGAQRSVDPASLMLGDTTLVTSIFTHTCGAFQLPMDLVFVVDISNSMTLSRDDGNDVATPTGKPGEDPTPTDDPGGLRDSAPLSGGLGLGSDRADQNEPPTPTSPPGRETPTVPGPGPIETPKGGEEQAGSEDLIREVVEAIRDFLDEADVQAALDNGQLQIALVSFNGRARTEIYLTDQDTRVISRLSRLRGTGETNVSLGLRQAETVLRSAGRSGSGEVDRSQVVMLFSDGHFDQRTLRGIRSRDDIKVVTLAAGRAPNQSTMRQLASEREYAIRTRDRKELMKLFREDLGGGRPVTMDKLVIRDQLTDNMALIPGSVNPVPDLITGTLSTDTGRLLEWAFPLPADRVTITYEVRPITDGLQPISVEGAAAWVDSETRPGAMVLPIGEVEVLVPPSPTPTNTSTPTATPTFTPSPTPTRTPAPRYMPLVQKDYVLIPSPTPKPCIPSEQTVDVALVIDTSNSMLEPTTPGGVRKLDAAVDAALIFLDNLKLPADQSQDQVTVIWFNRASGVEIPLSGDKVAIQDALRRLPQRQAPDTHIDKGLQAANDELIGPRHRPTSNRAIILLTDGRQDPNVGDAAVLAIANQAKATGIAIWTIGLGTDVDQALLTQVASKPEYFKLAPNPEDLEIIYREIAEVVSCG